MMMTVKEETSSICLGLETVLIIRKVHCISIPAGTTSLVVKASLGQTSSILEKLRTDSKGNILRKLIRKKGRR